MSEKFAEDVAQQHEEGVAKAKATRTSQQRAIDRITALFALAEDAAKRGDETERAKALDKATALQVQYAVEETMLRKTEGQAAEEVVSQDFFRGETNTTLIKAKRHLLNIVAQHNRGRAVLCGQWDPEKKKYNNRAYIQVFAHESDLRFISSMYTSLLVQLHTMMSRDEAGSKDLRGKLPNGWRVSYAFSWADRISARLWDIEKRQNPTHTPGTALVLRDRSKAVDAFMDDLYGKSLKRGKGPRRDAHSVDGARAGRTAADQADLGQKRTGANAKIQIEK